MDMGPLGMMYRSDLFEELGLTVPTTWDEFRSVAAQAKAAGSSIYLGNYDPSWAAMFAGLSWQAGAQWFTTEEDAWVVNIDSPETIQVAEYWQGLINDGLISREALFSPPLAQLYQNGDLLTNIAPVWESSLLQGNVPDQSGKWTAAPLPQWKAGESLSGNWGGSSKAVSASSSNPEAAAKFAYWLTTNEESIDIYINNSGIFPASVEGQALPAITAPSDFFGGQAHLSVFAEISEGVSTSWQWGPNMLSSNPIIQARLVEAFDNNTSVAEALRLANEEVKADLQAQGISVR
jgi:multiple sugar transport system substrate-binding protein